MFHAKDYASCIQSERRGANWQAYPSFIFLPLTPCRPLVSQTNSSRIFYPPFSASQMKHLRMHPTSRLSLSGRGRLPVSCLCASSGCPADIQYIECSTGHYDMGRRKPIVVRSAMMPICGQRQRRVLHEHVWREMSI